MAAISRFALFWKMFFVALISGSAATAASQEEVAAWNAAVSANTSDAYYLYLSLYPAGDYVDEALAALGTIGTTGAPRQVEVPSQPTRPKPPATAKPGTGNGTGGMY